MLADDAGRVPSIDARLRLGLALVTLGWFQLGLFTFQPPPPLSADMAAAQAAPRKVAEARRYMRKGAPVKAIPLYEELHGEAPRNHIVAAELAEAYHAVGRWADEARTWDEYVRIAPLPVEACPSWPRAWAHAGDERRALEAFERCHSFDPSDPDGIFFLAAAREQQGNVELAHQLYIDGLARSPGYTDMSVGLARTDLRRGLTQQSLERSAKILEREPDNVDALLIGGLAALRLDDLGRAEKWLHHGVELSPSYIDYQLALGILAERQGKTDEAIAHYRKMVAADPRNTEAAKALARLKRGS